MTRVAVFALTLGLVGSACRPAIDLTTGVRIERATTGWVDAGIVDGMNKLVPAVTFTVKNVSDQTLPALQVNAIFRRVTETEGWGDGFRSVSGSRGLAPGAAAGPLTLQAQLGYTGSDPAEQLLHHSQFVDVKVDVFAKYGSTRWTRVGGYMVARQLMERPRTDGSASARGNAGILRRGEMFAHPGDQLERLQARAVIEDLGRHHEFIRTGHGDDLFQPLTNRIR
jgi:hypothetical protein